MDTKVYEYVIDANDVVISVNESWAAFGEENHGEGLGERVIGTWLWQHFSGWEVKQVFRRLLERVREGNRVVRVPFRCDSPELRREMMVEVTPLSDGKLRFSSWIVDERDRPPVTVLEPGRTPDPNRSLRMCAWCKSVDAGGDEWRELEEAVGELEIFGPGPLPKITHGVCPTCKARVMAERTGGG
jgi:hypothetical protein